MSSVLVARSETQQALPARTPWTLAMTKLAADLTADAERIMIPLHRPYQRPDLSGTELRARPEQSHWHRGPEGLFDAQPVMPGQRVIQVPRRVWPAPRPEECPTVYRRAAWFDAHGHEMSESEVADLYSPTPVVLLCLNCGLHLG